jgi:GNAT superfamily N-acetyltransferase
VEVRPIRPDETGRIVMRCYPDGEAVVRLFDRQGTIGMAAWDGDICVGLLHGYAIDVPGAGNPDWPDWNRPAWVSRVLAGELGLTGRVWCHACCHVGRTLAAADESDAPDGQYFGRGIGTALCRASVEWASENGYAAVLADGKPSALFQLAVWHGGLPWTTYAKLGFESSWREAKDDELPGWAKGNSPPEVMDEVRAALASGRPPTDLPCRLMVRRLEGAERGR